MILIGYSGHSYVVHAIFDALGKKVLGYFDKEEKKYNPYNLKYFGKESSEEAFSVLKNDEFFIAIGDNTIRQKIYENFASRGYLPINAIHPSAIIDPTTILARNGIMINSHVSINALSRIGNAVICNTGSIIEHECEVGDFVHIGPGTVLCGNVSVGNGTFIGANAVIRQGVQIGINCTIGAGAVVIKDIPDNSVIAGNPAKNLEIKQVKKMTDSEPVEIKTASSKLKILFIGKADDQYSKIAGEFISLHFPETITIYGKRGELFPREATDWKGDIVISYLSQWIIPGHVLKNAAVMAINFHPGPPEYPGIGCTNFAVYDGVDEYGVTCHHMLAKVDTGKIISVKRFPVYKTDTVYSITQRCYSLILTQCFEIIDFIITGTAFPQSTEQWTRKPYLRKELNRLCRITPDMPVEEMNRRIKATNFVKHWAFMQVGDNIFKLVDEKNNINNRLLLDELLLPLDFLLCLSGRAYEKYMRNKIYLHALNIRKANEMIYQLMIEKIHLIPDEIRKDCIELLNHYDCWMLQFKDEEQKTKPALPDEFIFYRIDDQMAYPRLSEQRIFEKIKKLQIRKTKRS